MFINQSDINGKAVFLDKDGTIIPDIPYNYDPSKISLCQYVPEGLAFLAREGYELIIISNQPGIGYGYFGKEDMKGVENQIRHLLMNYSIHLSGFYYCPHTPDDLCKCRKPLPGLILDAAEERHIDLKNSWMIGDILNDVEAGNRAGCRTILISNGNETEWKQGPFRQPYALAANMMKAAAFILNKIMHE